MPLRQIRLDFPTSTSGRATPQSVVVTGSFDEWKQSVVMQKGDTSFTALVVVAEEVEAIQFKFVVDGEWTTTDSYQVLDDGAGNVNNVLPIQGLDAVVPALSESVTVVAEAVTAVEAAPEVQSLPAADTDALEEVQMDAVSNVSESAAHPNSNNQTAAAEAIEVPAVDADVVQDNSKIVLKPDAIDALMQVSSIQELHQASSSVKEIFNRTDESLSAPSIGAAESPSNSEQEAAGETATPNLTHTLDVIDAATNAAKLSPQRPAKRRSTLFGFKKATQEPSLLAAVTESRSSTPTQTSPIKKLSFFKKSASTSSSPSDPSKFSFKSFLKKSNSAVPEVVPAPAE
ncbi:hypothetical protein BJ741DRAFT_601075 [Chytriomyces cf. hyalinus JEL632]|nr:hypothetical protein BJ741DRAFT_601075 [Chytriomyces cf. hyalinus JEL632]